MFHRCLPILLLVLSVAPSYAQEGLPWANKFFTGKEEAPPPVIIQDFGTLPKGSVRTHRFTMTNIFAVPMQLMEPKPSCGCVSVIAYTNKMDPKETGQIDIKIDTSRVEGVKKVRLPVYFVGTHPKTGERFQSVAELEIRAVSRPDILMSPGAITFGVNPTGTKNTQTMTVTYNGRLKGWSITEVGFKKELFDVSVKPLDNRNGAVSYLLTATTREDMPAGPFEDQIVLRTNDPAAPALTINISGTVQSALSVFPNEPIRLGKVEIGSRMDKNVIVRADKPFKIISVDGQGDGVSVTLRPLAPQKTMPLTVVFAPEKAGAVKKTLTVKTDLGETVQISVEATGVEGTAK